tara:strand:+ start:1473 stop:1673 length:201 start_codon:yes stop_codon:yes gene_type:complete
MKKKMPNNFIPHEALKVNENLPNNFIPRETSKANESSPNNFIAREKPPKRKFISFTIDNYEQKNAK